MIETVMNAYRSDALAEGPSILVVDDEPSVRRLLGVLLQGYGYRAIMAADGVEARMVVEREEIAVILCDLHLRGESGLALVRDLLQVVPRAAALMMSGSDEPEAPEGTGEDLASGHIAKPFDVKDVVKRIAQVLCGRRMGAESASGLGRRWRSERLEVINA